MASVWTAFVVCLTWIDTKEGVPYHNTKGTAGKWLGDAFTRLGWVDKSVKGLTNGTISFEGRSATGE